MPSKPARRRLRLKEPSAYKKAWPGKHVLVLLAISPEPAPGGTTLIIEAPVSRELWDKIVGLYTDAVAAHDGKTGHA